MPAWLGKGLLLGSRILILSLHGGRGRGAFDEGDLFYKNANLIHKVLYPHDLSAFQRPYILIPSPCGLGLNMGTWGGHKFRP